MADLDGLKTAHDYHTDVPFAVDGAFYVKGAGNLDWGMKKHLSNIFNPRTGNTVMFMSMSLWQHEEHCAPVCVPTAKKLLRSEYLPVPLWYRMT